MINNRETVFVDTSAFIGLIVNSDSVHSPSVTIMSELFEKKCRLVTSEYIFFELANAFSAARSRTAAVNFIDQIATNPDVDIVWSSRELFTDSYELYQDRRDKNWSLTDCTSFIIMREFGISLAFTTDSHFEQAGFVRLLKI